MANHHDTGYKELFSYPEFVQQLVEGFAPAEIAGMMDFSTLVNHSGNYITPLFEERFEDVVWSVEVRWKGQRRRVYLYLLLEFQSTIDARMPIRLMHYVACFYDHLLKTKAASTQGGLPPVFPMVLYNGSQRWNVAEDIYEMLQPEPPSFLQAYQPHLRYYLVDEGRFSEAELAERQSPLSGVFGIENAAPDRVALQQAVERIVALIQAAPDKERLDKILTRWLKRHLHWLGARVALDSLIEDKDMLAENLRSWAEKEREEGREEGKHHGIEQTLRKLIGLKFGDIPPWAEEKLHDATEAELDTWVAGVLSADSLESLMGKV